ncbi:hypothetical protein [Trueperella pyogenes]|uniref:hypothetical protein n=1 Tax=Trueperella pyogenes TaxID=1661 RepID=UPI00345CC7E9
MMKIRSLISVLACCAIVSGCSSTGDKDPQTLPTQNSSLSSEKAGTFTDGKSGQKGGKDDKGSSPDQHFSPDASTESNQIVIGYKNDSAQAQHLEQAPAQASVNEVLLPGEIERLGNIFTAHGLTLAEAQANSGGAVTLTLSGKLPGGALDDILGKVVDDSSVVFAEPIVTATTQ